MDNDDLGGYRIWFARLDDANLARALLALRTELLKRNVAGATMLSALAADLRGRGSDKTPA